MLNRRLVGLLAPARLRLTGVVVLGLLITASYVAQGILVAYVLARVLTGSDLTSQLPRLAGVLVLLIGRSLLFRAREVIGAAAADAVKVSVRRRLYSKLLDLGPAYGLDSRTGTSVSTLVDGVENLDPYVAVFVPQLLVSVIGAIAIVITVIIIDPVVGSVVAASSVTVTFLPQLVRTALAKKHRNYWTHWRVLGADYLDAIQGMTTLKALGVSRAHGQMLGSRSREFYKASVGLNAISNLSVGTVGFVASAGIAVSVAVGAVRSADGQLNLVTLLLILMLSREAFRPLTELQNALHATYRVTPAAAAIFKLLDTSPDVTETTQSADALPTGGLGIEFDRVSFSYRPGSRSALTDFTVAIQPGETLALVGRSGAGKTTAISLLLRFFDPTAGRIRLGGTDLRDLPLQVLRSSIAVVSQDTYLFHGTIAENIGLGRADADLEQIRAAAVTANAEAFISALPDGYQTVIGERGLTLSGGERQRLAIARAVLMDAAVLVLDEATASIDIAGERVVREAIERVSLGRTTIVIAHRLSTVQQADQIVMLEGGHMVEFGDHSSLLAAGGAYSRLVEHQGPYR